MPGLLLVGEPVLESNLEQASARIHRKEPRISVQLRPLTREQTEAYLRHRLQAAGADDPELLGGEPPWPSTRNPVDCRSGLTRRPTGNCKPWANAGTAAGRSRESPHRLRSGSTGWFLPAVACHPGYRRGDHPRQSPLVTGRTPGNPGVPGAAGTPSPPGTGEPHRRRNCPARAPRGAGRPGTPGPAATPGRTRPRPRYRSRHRRHPTPPEPEPGRRIHRPERRRGAGDTPSAPTRPQAAETAGLRDAAWLQAQPAGHYTIQILGLSDLQALRRYGREQGLDMELAWFRTRRNGEDWYVLVAGRYPDAEAARAAIARLPEPCGATSPGSAASDPYRGHGIGVSRLLGVAGGSRPFPWRERSGGG
jgi:DamX protein